MDSAQSSVLSAIGNTPTINLARLAQHWQGTVYAKLEYFNPGLSKKDRIALQIIQDAEQQGLIKPGQTVVELTSGNTGTGLSIVCAIKGYPFVAVMSRGNSMERAQMMRAFGAEVLLVDQNPGSSPGQVSGADLALVEQKTREIVFERGAFHADQFKNESNLRAHYFHTGPELIEQTGGRIDAFCDFVGTGGSFAGCAAALKEFKNTISCFVVEPQSVAVLAGKDVSNPNHMIQGGGYGISPLGLLNTDHIDGYLSVSEEEAVYWSRQLAIAEGIFAGFSSGANLAAAVKLLEQDYRGGSIAILINDSGLKYLSTNLFEKWETGKN